MSVADLTAELVARVIEAPDDRESFLVYADQLMSHGDPRGELVALQAAPGEPTPEKTARIEELVAQLTDELFAGRPALQHDMRVTWRWGFIARLVLDSNALNRIDESGLLERAPALQFVRDVWIHGLGDNFTHLATGWLEDAPARHTIERISLGQRGARAMPPIILSGLVSLLPRLYAVQLASGDPWDLSPLRAVSDLVALTVRGPLTDRSLRPLADGVWRALRMLVLEQQTDDFPELVYATLRNLLLLPRLTELGLMRGDPDHALTVIGSSPYLDSLTKLAVSWDKVSWGVAIPARRAIAHIPQLVLPTFADLRIPSSELQACAAALRTMFERPDDAQALLALQR